MKYDEKKTLVFWGAGLIAKNCLQYHSDYRPAFLIDNNPKGVVDGVDVFSPSEIKNWKKLFIVITTIYAFDIEFVLESFGLIKDKDFVYYKKFFDINYDANSSLFNIKKYVESHSECKNGVLLYAPCFHCRQKEKMTNFFSHYIKKHEDNHIVVISKLFGVLEKIASKKVGAKVFDLVDVSGWNGEKSTYDYCYESVKNISPELSETELDFVDELEERKSSSNPSLSKEMTIKLYFYLKQMIFLLCPTKIIIWGGESRICFILMNIAQKAHIQYGFMEYGWIPGTYQFDPIGIAGQSEYAISSRQFLDFKQNNNFEENPIEDIINFVLKNQLDTGVFKLIHEDEEQLKKIKPNQKTIFLVGMGDAEMAMNSESTYWKEYVSNVVSSTIDSYCLIREICKKNNFNFMFKPHPHSRTKAEDDDCRSDKDTIYITDMSIDKLIQMSDVVVSIASAVDYKVLMYRKPLVSLGKTGLSGKNCVYEVIDKNEIENKVLMAACKGMTMEQFSNYKCFLSFLLEKYLWDDLSHPQFKYGLSLDKDFFD